MRGMTKYRAIEIIEFNIRHNCSKANGDNIGDCDSCSYYKDFGGCINMKALLTLAKGDEAND